MIAPTSLSRALELVQQHRTRLALAFLGVLAPLFVFGKLAEDVWAHEGFRWDQPVLEIIHTLSSPAHDALAVFVTNLGGPIQMASLAALVGLGLLIARRYAQAAFFLLAVGGAAAINLLAKLAFKRHRPELWISPIPEHDYGFPSGHAMGTMAVVLAIVVLVWPTRWRWLALVLGAVFALTVSGSRLYLGVHYPSDVVAGWAASLAWVISVSMIIQGRTRARVSEAV